INLLIGFALTHAEQASLHHLERVSLYIGQNKQKPVLRGWQGAVLIHAKLAGGPGVSHRGATLPYARGTLPRRVEPGVETRRGSGWSHLGTPSGGPARW